MLVKLFGVPLVQRVRAIPLSSKIGEDELGQV